MQPPILFDAHGGGELTGSIVICHADAGYEAAIETAEACDVAVPRRDQ